MSSILDPTLIAELAAVTTASMQTLKSHPKIKGSMIPWISGVFGASAGVAWYLVSGKIDDGHGFFNVDWANIFRGVFNGVAGSVSANGAFNIQKFLPLPNVLPTAAELDHSALKEEVITTAVVEDAVAKGVDVDTAKEAVGRSPDDPPLEEEKPIG